MSFFDVEASDWPPVSIVTTAHDKTRRQLSKNLPVKMSHLLDSHHFVTECRNTVVAVFIDGSGRQQITASLR